MLKIWHFWPEPKNFFLHPTFRIFLHLITESENFDTANSLAYKRTCWLEMSPNSIRHSYIITNRRQNFFGPPRRLGSGRATDRRRARHPPNPTNPQRCAGGPQSLGLGGGGGGGARGG